MERNDIDRKIDFLDKLNDAHRNAVDTPTDYYENQNQKVEEIELIKNLGSSVISEIARELNIGAPKNPETDLDAHK